MKKNAYKIVAIAASNMGLCRNNNEDNLLIGNNHLDEKDLSMTKGKSVVKQFSSDENYGVFAVSDGMGGESLGEMASSTVVSTLQSELKNTKIDILKEGYESNIREIITKINNAVLKRASELGIIKTGATLAMLVISDGLAQSVNVGDSRVYFLRKRKLVQISNDQTEAQLLLDAGLLNKKKLKNHPSRCRLLQYMGYKEMENNKLTPYFSKVFNIKPGDRFLICSDGLTDMLSDKEIRKLLMNKKADQKGTVESLIEGALNKGGKDNVTVTVIDVLSLKK